MNKSTSPCDYCMTTKNNNGGYALHSLHKTEESCDEYCTVYRCKLMDIGDKCKSLNKYRKKHNL